MAARGEGSSIGEKSARAGERPRSSGAGAEGRGLVVGSGRAGGGRTGTSNSIGESEGLLAVSFFFFSTFFSLPSFLSLDETKGGEERGIRRNRIGGKARLGPCFRRKINGASDANSKRLALGDEAGKG